MHQQSNIPCYSLLLQPNLFPEFFEYLSYKEMCSTLAVSRSVRQQLFLQKYLPFQYKASVLRLFLLKDVERYHELLERDILSQEDLDQLVFYKIYGEKPSIYFFQALASGVVTPVQLMSTPLMLTVLNEVGLTALEQGLFTFQNIINIEHVISTMLYYSHDHQASIDLSKSVKQLLNGLFVPIGLMAMQHRLIVPEDILSESYPIYALACLRLLESILATPSLLDIKPDDVSLFCELFFHWLVSDVCLAVIPLALVTPFLMSLTESALSTTGLMDCSLFFNAQSNATHGMCELFSDHELAAQCVG